MPRALLADDAHDVGRVLLAPDSERRVLRGGRLGCDAGAAVVPLDRRDRQAPGPHGCAVAMALLGVEHLT